MLLHDKVTIVTGAGRGLGAAIAREVASAGSAVAVNFWQSAEAAEAVVEQIRAKGGRAAAFQCDVRDGAAVTQMVAHVNETLGQVTGLVNNAIGGKQNGSFADATDGDYLGAFDFGCRAVVNTVRAVRPEFKAAGGGRVVNIVTELWNLAPAEWSVYMVGKGAMVGLSRSLAQELGPENITVNMVAPGWMATENVDTTSEGSKNFAKSLPLRRHGSAEEIGNACAFLLSDLASYITGAYIPVTGGRVTQTGV